MKQPIINGKYGLGLFLDSKLESGGHVLYYLITLQQLLSKKKHHFTTKPSCHPESYPPTLQQYMIKNVDVAPPPPSLMTIHDILINLKCRHRPHPKTPSASTKRQRTQNEGFCLMFTSFSDDL